MKSLIESKKTHEYRCGVKIFIALEYHNIFFPTTDIEIHLVALLSHFFHFVSVSNDNRNQGQTGKKSLIRDLSQIVCVCFFKEYCDSQFCQLHNKFEEFLNFAIPDGIA